MGDTGNFHLYTIPSSLGISINSTCIKYDTWTLLNNTNFRHGINYQVL